jgi:hypothetical protein
VVSRHRRFELLNVTLDDQPIGSATIDAWDDETGQEQWSARILMKSGHPTSDGILAGSTRDGRTLRGPVRVANDQQGPGGARTVLVEFHGLGPLEERDPSVDAKA